MSAIDPTAPLDTALASEGDDRMREERQQLIDLWTAFKVRYQDGLTPNDPGTSFGQMKVPVSAPGSPKVGDFYITDAGLMYSYKTGPTAQLTGDLEANTVSIFRQTTAPTGWTRTTTGSSGAGLRYRASASLTSGGTNSVRASLGHAWFNFQAGGGGTTVVSTIPNHALKYLDVIEATRG